MTLGKPSSSINPTPKVTGTSLGWTGREKEIIFRNLAARAPPGDDHGVTPVSAPSGAHSIRLSPRRRRLDRGQIAVLAILGLALIVFIVGALTSTERSGTPVPQVAARPPAEESRTAIASAPPRAAPTQSDPRELSSVSAAAPEGRSVVRAFYDALGRGDGEAASALVVAEKRSTEAFSPQAISRFYGGLREPLRLMSITPLDGHAFRVSYRYSAGRSPCDGAAVVSLASRDGRDLIRSIRALNGC